MRCGEDDFKYSYYPTGQCFITLFIKVASAKHFARSAIGPGKLRSSINCPSNLRFQCLNMAIVGLESIYSCWKF
jgi:hypothetical protein